MSEVPSMLIAIVFTVIAFIGLPLLFIRYIYKGTAADYGWRLPDPASKPVLLTLIVLVPHVVLGFVLATLPETRGYYQHAEETRVLLFVLGFFLSAIYFAAEEFLFRGYLLWVFWNKHKHIGVAISIVLFALLHVGKTPIEIPVALISGTALAWLAFKTKSFIPAAIVHFVFALVVNVLVNFVYT